MKKLHKKRLLNVAKACRETKYAKIFAMDAFGYAGKGCGTPACALGNYAFRRDLQRSYKLDGNDIQTNDCASVFNYGDEFYEHGGFEAWGEMKQHFGLTQTEMDELFSAHGCGGAKTNIAAAEYIENFVLRQQESK